MADDLSVHITGGGIQSGWPSDQVKVMFPAGVVYHEALRRGIALRDRHFDSRTTPQLLFQLLDETINGFMSAVNIGMTSARGYEPEWRRQTRGDCVIANVSPYLLTDLGFSMVLPNRTRIEQGEYYIRLEYASYDQDARVLWLEPTLQYGSF